MASDSPPSVKANDGRTDPRNRTLRSRWPIRAAMPAGQLLVLLAASKVTSAFECGLARDEGESLVRAADVSPLPMAIDKAVAARQY